MTSWQVIGEIRALGKWKRIFLTILWTWTLLIVGTPYLNEKDSTGDLSGSVGIYDNKEIINGVQLKNKFILINFFASLCAPCKIEHQLFFIIKKDFPNLFLLGVNYKDKELEAKN